MKEIKIDKETREDRKRRPEGASAQPAESEGMCRR